MSFKVFLSRSYQQSFNRAYPAYRSSHAYFYDVLMPVAITMEAQGCETGDYVSLVLTATMDVPSALLRDTARKDFWYLLQCKQFVSPCDTWNTALRAALNQRIVAEVPEFADHGLDPRSNDIRMPLWGSPERSYCFEGIRAFAHITDVCQTNSDDRVRFLVVVEGRRFKYLLSVYARNDMRAMWKQADHAVLEALAKHGRFPLSGK